MEEYILYHYTRKPVIKSSSMEDFLNKLEKFLLKKKYGTYIKIYGYHDKIDFYYQFETEYNNVPKALENTKKYLTYISTKDPCTLFRDFYYVNKYNNCYYYLSYKNDIIKNIYHIHAILNDLENKTFDNLFRSKELYCNILSLLYLKCRVTSKNKERINELTKLVKQDLLSWKMQVEEKDEKISNFISNLSFLIALKTTY